MRLETSHSPQKNLPHLAQIHGIEKEVFRIGWDINFVDAVVNGCAEPVGRSSRTSRIWVFDIARGSKNVFLTRSMAADQWLIEEWKSTVNTEDPRMKNQSSDSIVDVTDIWQGLCTSGWAFPSASPHESRGCPQNRKARVRGDSVRISRRVEKKNPDVLLIFGIRYGAIK